MATCSFCGANVPHDQSFCHTCGSAIGGERASQNDDFALGKTLSTAPASGTHPHGNSVAASSSSPSGSRDSGRRASPDSSRGTLALCEACGAELEGDQSWCPHCGRGNDAGERDSLLGATIADNFRIAALPGEGAMGKVYRARQLSLDKIVAIKVLHPHLAGDRSVARRFHREARAASRLNHPNSLHIIDFGQTDDRTLFIAMELVEGRDLHQVIKEDYPLPLERIVALVGDVCLALDEAHAAGIVHRDLKPENIMVVKRRDGQEQIKVCDFGIAKIQEPGDSNASAPITVAGIVCGTPEYMSPEQCRGETPDGRADLYSVGVILYQLVTTALPFVADTPLGVVTRQLTDSPVPPTLIQARSSVAAKLEPIITRALAKDRDLRYSSALDLKSDLDRVLAGETIAPPLPRDRGESKPTKSRWPFTVALATLVALGSSATVWMIATSDQGRRSSEGDVTGEPDQPPRELSGLEALNRPDARIAAIETAQKVSTTDADLSFAGDEPTPEQAKLVDVAAARVSPAPHKQQPVPRRPEKASEPTTAPVTVAASDPTMDDETPPQKSAATLGREAFNAGDISQAIQHFEDAKRSNPSNADVHLMLGKCYYRVGQTNLGRAAYRRYLELRPNAPNRAFLESIINN